jgi:hypothetical protein
MAINPLNVFIDLSDLIKLFKKTPTDVHVNTANTFEMVKAIRMNIIPSIKVLINSKLLKSV